MVNHHEKFELEELNEANDISNPHYSEFRVATNSHLHLLHEQSTLCEKPEIGPSVRASSNPEPGCNPIAQEYPHPEVEERAQMSKSCSDQIKNQESSENHNQDCSIETDVFLQYAVVNKSNKTPKLQTDDISVTEADSMENPQYHDLKQNRSTKDIVTSEESETQNLMENLRERSPSPEYAELSTREKIPKDVTKCQAEKELQERDCRSDLHGYDKVASTIIQTSAEVSKGEPEKVEQHYYYTLENPEESCSDNKRNFKEEMIKLVNTGEKKCNMLQTHHAGDLIVMDDKHGRNPSIREHSHSEAERVAQINYIDQAKSQESHGIKKETESDLMPEYAVVDKSKKALMLQGGGSSAIRTVSSRKNPQDGPAKDNGVISEEGNQMEKLREKSCSPEYAELSVRGKTPKVTKCPTKKELQEKDSHEYDKVASMAQASANVTKGESEVVEQHYHYYYILENPEKSCSDIKGTDEIVNTGVKKYNMPQDHHLATGDKSIVPNTGKEAELVNDTNASALDSHPEEDKV